MAALHAIATAELRRSSSKGAKRLLAYGIHLATPPLAYCSASALGRRHLLAQPDVTVIKPVERKRSAD